jgi:hypothetical protein
MALNRKKFSTQADPNLLAELHLIAEIEGRQFQAVIEDAMREFIERRKGAKPNPVALSHFRASVERNRELYKLLAQ